MKIVAIDPGMTGSAAILEQIDGTVMLVSVIDLPTVGEGSKRRLDSVVFAGWLRHHAPSHAFIENAQPMSRQGISSTFRYARAAGAVEGTVAALRIPLTMVAPVTWKKFFKLTSSKEHSRLRAVQLLPSAADELRRVKDHNKAESILLAFYGLEKGLAA
jgi:crossover junction endodeoxyribonuclease RuvC